LLAVTRDELIRETRRLIAEGERLQRAPTLGSLRLWLQLSDDLLSTAWGPMDRYHLAWLMVGKPRDIVRGRRMTPAEEADYVREVAEQKTAALRMSLKAVEEQRMPFRGETGSGVGAAPTVIAPDAGLESGSEGGSDLRRRLAEAREHADRHAGHATRGPRGTSE
jgi:hypothetical protein